MPTSNGSERHPGRLKILRAAALLPGIVAVAIPALLLWLYGIDIGWGLAWPLAALIVLVGAGLILGGLRLWYETVRLFAAVGEGTLAPWDPTRKLVALGPYRRVRNPMISAVGFVLLGEAGALGSVTVLIELAIFALVNATVIPLAEEPDLVRRFGEDYERYRRAVPRWIPRRTPWTGGEGP